jgi:hypothetical protein
VRHAARFAVLVAVFLAASCGPQVTGKVGPPVTPTTATSSCQPETCDTAP